MTTTADQAVNTSADDTPNLISPRVSASLRPGTATEVSITAGDHGFTIDEPPSLGGSDKGANPVEHLLGALSACQVITYQVWSQKLGLQIDSIDIAAEGQLDLRGFFGLDDDVRPGFESIEFTVTVTGPESDEAYADLVRQVDEHCPVLDSLVSAVPVASTFHRG
jgi:uncharacterized OsmC-like protein